DIVHEFHAESGTVRARRVERYDALVLAEHPIAADPAVAADLLAAAWLERGPEAHDERLIRRLRFAAVDFDIATAVRTAADRARRLDELALTRALPPRMQRELDRHAPDTIDLPSGRRARLEYADDGTVGASVKLQELFGLADTPRIGPRRVPVAFALL